MKQTSPALIAFLLGRKPVVPAELFQFVFADGTAMNLTSYTNNITYNGILYYSSNNDKPIVSRTGWSIKNTIEIPEMTLTLLSTGSDYGSINIKRAIVNGLLDGCTMVLTRLFLDPQNNMAQVGSVVLWSGVTGPVTGSITGAKITFRGHNVRMDQNFPKNLYTAGCMWSLYGSGCKADRATFTFQGVVAGGTALLINWENVPAGSYYVNFGLGYVEFTSGVASGDVRSVQSASTTGVQLAYPLDVTPMPGDTFNIAYGCTKTKTYCQSVFNNAQHWRGFPYVPPAETAF